MGFGDDALGDVPLGQPPADSQYPTVQARQKALFFDAKTRDFPTDEDGLRYQETDQATAACQTALFQLRRRIPSSPTTGTTLDQRDPFSQRAQSEVDADVRRALDPIARRGWISNIRIRMQPVSAGGMKVEVDVYNRLIGEDRTVFSSEA